MNSKMNKQRRGLSSIVGALIFVVLMVATFSAVLLAFNSQTDIVDTNKEVADSGLAKQQEQFSIGVSADGSIGTADLEVLVNNAGQNPVNIHNMVITNVTQSTQNYPTKVHDIPGSSSFIAPSSEEDILENTPMKIILPTVGDPPEFYNFKVISSLGTIKSVVLECKHDGCGQASVGGSLVHQLFLDGPTGINTKTSTIVMMVTNTDSVTITDVRPTNGFTEGAIIDGEPDSCDDMVDSFVALPPPAENKFSEGISNCNVTPNIPIIPPDTTIDLAPYQTAFFTWDVTIHGDIGAVATFCNSVTGIHPVDGPLAALPDDCDELEIIDPNDCDGCGPGGETIILIDDLLNRPELFMIIPSPFGDSDNNDNYKGLWGVNVVNPTERSMKISKLTIVVYPPGANNNDIVIDSGSCIVTGVTPAADWSCPRLNTLMWENHSSPITIPARSNVEFLTLVEPGQIAGNLDVDALIVQANAFTTAGAFGKSSYQSTMFDTPESIVNVFLTSTPQSRTDIQSDVMGLPELTPHTFNMTIADMDDDDTTYLQNGTRLVINVPREWTDVAITDDTNFHPDTDPGPDDSRVTLFGDGSYQIVALTDGDLGGGSNLVDAFTLEFTATPPENDGGEEKQLYIMYVLADGVTAKNDPIGPLNEIVLQVLAP